MEIDKLAVQAELQCILTSRCFRSRKILQRLLAYLVTQTLADNSPPITQHAIAVEGLGKSADFNASTDPVIRIQVGRLRKQLEDYYATEGRFNTLRINLPIRSYQAVFTQHHVDIHHLPVVPEALSLSLSQGPSIVCIPRTFSTDAASSWPFITRLARDYVTALTHFNFCQVLFADETAQQHHHWPDDAWHAYGADFALFLDLHNEASGYSLKCSLVHSQSRQAIWALAFPLGDTYPAASTLHTLFKRIANDTLNYERGVAHDYWARWLLDSGKPIAPHHQVMLALRQQQWVLDVDTFNQVLRTCEQRLEQHPHDVQAMLVYADMYRTEYLLKYNAMLLPVTYVAQVVDTLMQLAPGNAYSHLYLAGFHLLTGNRDLCLEALAQAQAINSLDTHLNATTGLIYTGLGDWHTGVSYIQDSIDISPIYPDWYHIPVCLHLYREKSYAAALQEARKIRLKNVWGPVLRSVLYQRNQLRDKAHTELGSLTQNYPDFAKIGRELRQGFPQSTNLLVKQLWEDVTSPEKTSDER